MEDKKYPRIGIGVMIENKNGELLLGLRQGSFAAEVWCFPGGHLDFGEKMETAARREVREEVGLEVGKLELVSVADELRYVETDGKHFVNIGFKAEYVGGEPKLMEPEKCKEWRWFNINELPNNLLEGTELILKNFKAQKIY